MRNAQGGTGKWCPRCQQICVVKVVPLSSLGYAAGQRYYRTDHKAINWFRRGLECQDCFHSWPSAELPESYILELIKLRDALQDIKTHAETYSKEAEGAATSLAELRKSLSVLLALEA
jgi:hypothetical protein